ncbi:MAG: hypothetical protein ACRC30_11505 [Clostridium sp.]
MLEIGGFFELELKKATEYHNTKYKLNNGRNAVKFILEKKKYKKIYMPVYTCDSVYNCIKNLSIEIEEYNIDEEFLPKIDYSKIKENECILYVNYFGICGNQISKVYKKCKKESKSDLIVDNTQGFFEKPKNETHTIYSARKFFGVPDGSYLHTEESLDYNNLEKCKWGVDSLYLLDRIEQGASLAYPNFREAAKKHSLLGIQKMSDISQRILESIDYKEVLQRRNENFKYLHEELKSLNKLDIDIEKINGAMVYPFYHEQGEKIRKELIAKKIYIAKYWEDVLIKKNASEREKSLAKNIVAIPIDQRYGIQEMKYIINEFNNILRDK